MISQEISHLSMENNRTFDKKVSSTFQLCNHLFAMSNYVAFNETIPEDLWWPMNVDHVWITVRNYGLLGTFGMSLRMPVRMNVTF